MKDEILNKVYSTDETPIPRYQIVDRDGNVVLSGVEIRLLNLISQLGTPYNTESVLPDSVANKICPEILDPSPADAFAGLLDAVKKAAPVNLLDNSDFRNPVNQRGFTGRASSSAGTTDVLDRWLWWNVSSGNAYDISITKGIGFTVNAKSGATRLLQKLDPATFDGTTYTSCFCMCSDGTLIQGGVDNTTLGGGVYSALFDIPAGKTVIWAVAYKGHYTAETLPEYRPKGYGAELTECLRYLYKPMNKEAGYLAHAIFTSATNGVCTIITPVPMRVVPTFSRGSGFMAYSNNGTHEVTEYSVIDMRGNEVLINFTISGGAVCGGTCVINNPVLSAEL